MKKQIILFIVIIIIVLGAIIYTKSNEDSELETTKPLKIGYNIQSVNYGLAMIAQEKDLFNKFNLPVELFPVESGSETRQALSLGKIDISFTNNLNVLILVNLGAPVKIISPAAMARNLLFVRQDQQIRTFDDLRGKKICGAGGIGEFVFVSVLKQEGIDESEVELIDISKDYRGIALLEQKVIDAIPTSYYNGGLLEKQGAVLHEEWQEKGYSDKFWPTTFIAVNTDYLADNSDKVEKFIDVMIEAHKFIINNQDEAAQLVAKHINEGTDGVAEFSSEGIIKTWQEGLSYVAWVDPSVLTDTSKFYFERGKIDSFIPLEQIFDSRFMDKLKSAQQEIYGSEN